MKKKTLIVAATYEELALTFKHWGWQKSSLVEKEGFDIFITGVGITSTAFALGQRLNHEYSFVLNVGIAGSFDKTMQLGSLVNIISDTLSELGAENEDKFIPIDELGFGKSTFHSNFRTKDPLINNLPTVKGITVNTVHGHSSRINGTLARLPVKTESMEGAAIFYACEQLNIPVLQIRCISNYVEPRNKENWKIDLALKNLNEWLINYLNANFVV